MKRVNNRMSIIPFPDLDNIVSVEKYVESIDCVLLSLGMSESDFLNQIDDNWNQFDIPKDILEYIEPKNNILIFKRK